VSGDRVTFVGEAMSTIVQGIAEVEAVIGQRPVVVGGIAVLCRLSNPYRATTDLDVVDRGRSATPHLQVLRAVSGAEPVEPAAVLLPTAFGPVKVDVLEVRHVEIDHPSDDPGDRLHASAHAWAHDAATKLTIEAVTPNRVAETHFLVGSAGLLRFGASLRMYSSGLLGRNTLQT
jgi:hypothetical protein